MRTPIIHIIIIYNIVLGESEQKRETMNSIRKIKNKFPEFLNHSDSHCFCRHLTVFAKVRLYTVKHRV